MARVAEQRGTRDPDAMELEDDLGAGVDRGHRRGGGGGDEVRVGPGRDAPPAVMGEEQLSGGRRAPATGGRPDPRAGRRHAVGRVDRHLDEPRTADPLGEDVAGRDARSHRRRDPVAGEQRDPELRPFDDERPGRDERQRGVGRHVSRPGQRTRSQRRRASRRSSLRSGSWSGTSRRSTTRPARPPVTGTAKRRPRAPRSAGPRNESSAEPACPGGDRRGRGRPR